MFAASLLGIVAPRYVHAHGGHQEHEEGDGTAVNGGATAAVQVGHAATGETDAAPGSDTEGLVAGDAEQKAAMAGLAGQGQGLQPASAAARTLVWALVTCLGIAAAATGAWDCW